MQKFTSVKSDRMELRLAECQATFSAAPVSASLAVQNGTNGKLTLTSVRGEDIGNATAITFTMSTNAASVSLSGYSITVDLHKDGTNAFSDTTASNVKTLLEANTNITQLVSVATNTAGIMATATKAFLTGGDDKLTLVTECPAVTLTRDFKGIYSVDFSDASLKLTDFVGPVVADVSSDSATASGVAKVEVTQEAAKNTFSVKFFDYAGAATDVATASKMHLVLAGQVMGASQQG